MTLGIPTSAFLSIHVVLSLIGLASGLVMLGGLIIGKLLPLWTGLFLATNILTSLTGFPLAPFGFDPPRAVGVLALILLIVAVIAVYSFELRRSWRWAFIATATAALYLDAFVGVVQAFQKLPFLHTLAPQQTEAPFVVAQVVVLAIFVALGAWAVLIFHPAPVAEAGVRHS